MEIAMLSARLVNAATLAVALIIDIMKPASLGFVTPGMRVEYGLEAQSVALLPLSALLGTALGSFIWGALADLYGRRASILLSSVMFVGTSICGAMPSFWWNVGMCFLMGAAAGGMLPVAYTLSCRDNAHAASRLVPRSRRGSRDNRGIFRRERAICALTADIRLADHVVLEHAYWSDSDRNEPSHP